MRLNIILTFVMILIANICFSGIYMEIWESINKEEPVITYHFYENNIWKIEDTNGLITIIDFNKNKLIVIYKKEHIYSTNVLSDLIKNMSDSADNIQSKEDRETKVEFRRIYVGKEVINGMKCDHYQIYESGSKIEDIWLSDVKILKPLESLFALLKGLGKPTDEVVSKASKEDEEIDKLIKGLGFPIKVVSYTSEGEVVSEVKYIEERKIDMDDLKEPVGYDKVPIMEVYLRAYGAENN
jgi:hypothetical protein